jgi:hypothetical protein
LFWSSFTAGSFDFVGQGEAHSVFVLARWALSQVVFNLTTRLLGKFTVEIIF